MRINNGIIEKSIKDNQIPRGFVKGRLKKKKKIDFLILLISKEDLYKYYILENHSVPDTVDHFNLERRGHLVLLLRYYNIHKDPKEAAKYTKRTRSHESYVSGGLKSAETLRKHWDEKSEQEKLNWSLKQKVAHSTDHFKTLIKLINLDYYKNLPQEQKDIANKKRSDTLKKLWIVKHDELLSQMRDSRIKNKLSRGKLICRTNQEQKIYDCLIQMYPNLIYDKIIDSRYPFFVDFYIPDLDLFIEYQGHPAHGLRPYNKDDDRCLLECYKLYGGWLDMYCNKDVDKYNIAIENKINLIRVYPNISLLENYELNQNKFKDIVDLVYNSIK